MFKSFPMMQRLEKAAGLVSPLQKKLGRQEKHLARVGELVDTTRCKLSKAFAVDAEIVQEKGTFDSVPAADGYSAAECAHEFPRCTQECRRVATAIQQRTL